MASESEREAELTVGFARYRHEGKMVSSPQDSRVVAESSLYPPWSVFLGMQLLLGHVTYVWLFADGWHLRLEEEASNIWGADTIWQSD